MAAPPTSNRAPPAEPPSLPVQDKLLQEIFLPTTVIAPSSEQIPPPAPSIADIPDVLLEDIFLRLPAVADLARASFRRVIKDHAFLRRYRDLHPPPLVGVIADTFIPAQPPHPSAVAARAFAGFDFSCSSFLPSTAGRSWSEIDFLDGRALLAGAPVDKLQASRALVGSEVCHFHYRQFLVRDLAVCDPVHRRYVLLPAVPGDLKALVRKQDLLGLETFLAPGDDDENPLSFRVMCLAECRMNLLLLVFSSSDRQWHVRSYEQWSSQDTFASVGSFEPAAAGLSDRQYAHGCFYWHLHFMGKLLVLDGHTMEFSAFNFPPEQPRYAIFYIVEAAEGMIGMLTKVHDKDSEDDPFCLTYSIMRNKQWHSEKVIPLPAMRPVLVGAAGGYLLMKTWYTTSSLEKVKFGYFSVDVKTLQVEFFAELSETILLGQLYAGFPPSLCAPTI